MARLRSKLTARINLTSTVFIMAAATMMLALSQNVAAEEYKVPGAIAAEPDEKFRKAWTLFHDKEIRSHGKEPIAEAAILLRMSNGYGAKVSEDTFNTSFAYRLLVAKMPGRYGAHPGEVPAGNIALRHFDAGVSYLYRQQNIPARIAFARGIFTAAQLGEKDYKALQCAGINAIYDIGATIEANALKLANTFVGADVSNKEKILRVVADKFSGVEANNSVTDWNLPAYHLKAVYWNLGFFLSAHWLVGNSSTPDDKKIMQEALDMRNTIGWANNTFWGKFKYHTCDNDML